jgi:hypothetical protein
MLILPFDFDSAQMLVASCMNSDNERIRTSARALNGKIDSNLVESYRILVEKIRLKRKLE